MSGFQNPPSCNTGGKPGDYDFGLDWFGFTFSEDVYSNFWEIVAKYYPLQFSRKDARPAPSYRHVTEFQDGPKVSQSDDRSDVHAQFSGQVMKMITLGEQVSMLRELLAIGCNPTRIDPRRDDLKKKLVPSQLKSWAEQGFLCRFKTWQPIEKYKGTVSQGLTFAAGMRGSKGSGIYMRIYEWHHGKDNEKVNGRDKKGEFDAVRFEAELTGFKASQFAESLAQAGSLEDIVKRINDCILGSIDFREGDKSKSFRDRKRIKEWVDYVSDIPVYKYVRPKRIKPEGFPVGAFKFQWGGKLADLLQVAGVDTFMRVIRAAIADGCDRGYGASLPAERVLRTVDGFKFILENLSHTRRQRRFLEVG